MSHTDLQTPHTHTHSPLNTHKNAHKHTHTEEALRDVTSRAALLRATRARRRTATAGCWAALLLNPVSTCFAWVCCDVMF